MSAAPDTADLGLDAEPEPDVDPWYRRAARGALAGFAGTAAMSLVQWPVAFAASEDPPPVEIGERLHRILPGRQPPRRTILLRSTALHLAFGTAAGALYGIAAPRRHREVTGIGFAALIWAASYFGYLPTVGLHRTPHRDPPLRQAGNAAAHVVYGLSLAEGMRLTA